jgi:hypothetical protein
MRYIFPLICPRTRATQPRLAATLLFSIVASLGANIAAYRFATQFAQWCNGAYLWGVCSVLSYGFYSFQHR